MMLQNVTSAMLSLKKMTLLFMFACMGMANVASATLPTPSNFTVQFNYNSPYSAYVHWNYVTGADSYLIFWHNVSTGAWGQSNLVYSNSYTHYASAGDYVEFNIWAVNSKTSEISNALPSYVGVYMAPPNPTNLWGHYYFVNGNLLSPEVYLHWDATSFSAGGFYIYRAESANGPWQLIATLDSSARSYYDGPYTWADHPVVIPNHTYYYTVTAFNPTCWSFQFSNVVSFTLTPTLP